MFKNRWRTGLAHFDGGNTHFWSEIACMADGVGRNWWDYAAYSCGRWCLFWDFGKITLSGQKRCCLQAMAHFCQGLSIEAFKRLPITIVIDNNGGLDCISQQERLFATNICHRFCDPFHAMCEGLDATVEPIRSCLCIAPRDGKQ